MTELCLSRNSALIRIIRYYGDSYRVYALLRASCLLFTGSLCRLLTSFQVFFHVYGENVGDAAVIAAHCTRGDLPRFSPIARSLAKWELLDFLPPPGRTRARLSFRVYRPPSSRNAIIIPSYDNGAVCAQRSLQEKSGIPRRA